MEIRKAMAPVPIVWVVSLTQKGADFITCKLQDQLRILEVTPRVISSALETINLAFHPLGALKDDPLLCAVVLRLERTDLNDPDYVNFLRWCIDQVVLKDDFRLLVYMEDITLEELRKNDLSENADILNQLHDTIQLSEMREIHQIGKHLISHIQNLNITRKKASWFRFRLSALGILSRIAAFIQILCIIPALFLAFWLPVWDVNATLHQFAGIEEYIAVICGIAGFPFLVLLIFVYTRYGFPLMMHMREDRMGVLYSGIASFLTPLILLIPFRLHAPFEWILLGLAIGFIVDEARRNGYMAQREQRSIDLSTICTRHGRLPEKLKKQAGNIWINPLRCPLMPLRRPRVFVSYTRSSVWADKVLKELLESLSTVGVKVFTDAEIPLGSNWRRELNRQIGYCTIFVSIADPISVEREWPAAEAEAALAGKDLTGLPEYIMIMSPDLPSLVEDRWRWLPVFKELLLHQGSGSDDKPYIFLYNENTAQLIGYTLHPKVHSTISVLPSALAKLLYRLWFVPLTILTILGVAGPIAGFLVLLILVLNFLAGINTLGWLHENVLLSFIFILCALWAGYTARVALESWFFYQHRHANSNAVALLIFTTSLIMLQFEVVLLVDPFIVGWAFIIGIASFKAANEICSLYHYRNPRHEK